MIRIEAKSKFMSDTKNQVKVMLKRKNENKSEYMSIITSMIMLLLESDKTMSLDKIIKSVKTCIKDKEVK